MPLQNKTSFQKKFQFDFYHNKEKGNNQMAANKQILNKIGSQVSFGLSTEL